MSNYKKYTATNYKKYNTTTSHQQVVDTYSGLIQKLAMSDICRHTPTDPALTVHV